MTEILNPKYKFHVVAAWRQTNVRAQFRIQITSARFEAKQAAMQSITRSQATQLHQQQALLVDKKAAPTDPELLRTSTIARCQQSNPPILCHHGKFTID